MIDIEAEAVPRVIRNPDGLYSEQDGPCGYQLSRVAADNRLRILREEWLTLGIRAQQDVHNRPESCRAGALVMSLLHRGTETVKVFQEIQTPEIDSDGDKRSRAALIGTTYRASVQPLSSTDNADGGFNTEIRCRLRLINYPGVLGAQSQIEWRGKRYAIDGDPKVYSGIRRTAHADYVMARQ